jgi:hypothetical protein
MYAPVGHFVHALAFSRVPAVSNSTARARESCCLLTLPHFIFNHFRDTGRMSCLYLGSSSTTCEIVAECHDCKRRVKVHRFENASWALLSSETGLREVRPVSEYLDFVLRIPFTNEVELAPHIAPFPLHSVLLCVCRQRRFAPKMVAEPHALHVVSFPYLHTILVHASRQRSNASRMVAEPSILRCAGSD